ncbi:MAG: hypothetical protein HY744_27235 [Deltaproteobacteria bacterium]|nr:hypothetical protein [Deltaproteobacteria bacterium]
MIVVADSGPLLHLHWVAASRWALPPCPMDVVEEVWLEVERHARAALADDRLRRITVSPPISRRVAPLCLDAAEACALSHALSQQRDADVLVLCDELRARHACAELGLAVVGSIGLVVEAHRAGRAGFAAARDALEALPTLGRLHVSPALVARAIESLAR